MAPRRTSPVVEAEGGRVAGSEMPPDTSSRPNTTDAQWRGQMEAAYAQRSRYASDIMTKLTSAAEVMDPSKNEGPMPNAVSRTWQHAVYGYSRVVPELGVAAIYVGNCLSRCSLATGKRNPDGSVEQQVDAEAPANEGGIDPKVLAESDAAIANLQTPRGGQSELLRSYGEKDFLCGEAYLVEQQTPSGTRYDCLSVNELLRSGDHYSIYYGPGYAPEQLDPSVKPIRIWRPDAQYGRVATSSVRSCIEILEELAILTRLVRASAISRMALSGILAIAEEFDTPQNRATPDGNQSEASTPFFVDMVNTGAKAIDDPASAASWSPFLLVGPRDLIETGIKYIKLGQDDALSIAHRDEALQRLAQGLDLPVEVIMGHQSTTFANAAQVNEDTFKLHIEPALARLCDALTVAYLWPTMAANRGIQPESIAQSGYPDEIMSVAVTYDATALVSKPDRSALLLDTYWKDPTQMSIRLAEVRDVLGLDPDQLPDLDEVSARLDAKRLGNIKETVAAPPSDAAVGLARAAAGGAVKPGESAGAAAIEAGKTSGALPPGVTATTATDDGSADDTPPVTASAHVQVVSTDGGMSLAYMVAGAADVTLQRAVEKIGQKLRTKVRGAEATAVSQVENDRVAATLGPAAVKRLLGRDVPAAAELRSFGLMVQRWATVYGSPDPGAAARAAVQLVATRLAVRLYSDTPDDATPTAVYAELLSSL